MTSANIIKTNIIKTNIIVSHAAFQGAEFKEAVDLALVAAAFDQDITLIFIQQGIYNLIKGQNADALNDKTHTDILTGLEFYDIEKLWVERESLDQTGLLVENLIDGVSIIEQQQINQSNQQANHLVNF